ncbi:MAG: GNAT family N-acetyltransferase [Rhodococcus sp.]|nr:GNAT family N-acetyltransferase [Rhodococcus sp. (in: high G+C Gram-positive bacteria)]
MTTTPDAVALGTRVVVRHRLPPGYSHPMTDVIGVLESHEPLTVRTADGRAVQIATDQVIAVKALGARPIRTGEIRAVEMAAALGWPGTESAWIGGWLARYGHGITGRANSASPLGMPGELEPFDAVADQLRTWYAERGLPLRLSLPDRLTPALIPADDPDPMLVMAADLSNLTLPEQLQITQLSADPQPEWLALYPFRNDRRDIEIEVLRAVRGGDVVFGWVGNPGNTAMAIARVAITRAPDGRIWAGLSCIEVAPEHRRRGVGTLLCAEMLTHARSLGATHAYLQVSADNPGAIEMYRKIGFTEHHRYRYVDAN